MVCGNLPVPLVREGLHLVGLEQVWNVFAPEPVQMEIELEAILLFADGTEQTWHPPRATPALAPLTYHWELWARAVVTGNPAVALATAQWVAARPGLRKPVQVTLRRRWYKVEAPGGHTVPRWSETDFYVYRLPP